MTPLVPNVRPVTLQDSRSVNITTGQPKSPLPIQGKPKDDDKWWALALLIGLDDIEQAKATWRRLAPPKFTGLMGGRRFSFNRATQQYVRDGSPIPDAEVRSAYLDVLNKATDGMKRDATRMTTGALPLGEWQAAQAKRIKDLYIASRGVGVGGLDKLTPEDMQAITGAADDDNGLANALLRLRRFGGQIARGDSTAASAGTIVNRAGMYASPAYPIYQAGVTAGHGNAVDEKGVKIEFEQLNVLSNSEHCASGPWTMGCEQVTEAGWTAPGILPECGERTCGSHCRCYWAWRVKPPAKLTNLRPEHFKPGTDEPMQMSANTMRAVTLGDGRRVSVLALAAAVKPTDARRAEMGIEGEARERYLRDNPNLSAKVLSEIEHGHGQYIGSCGHRDHGCRCGGGGSYKMSVPCRACREGKTVAMSAAVSLALNADTLAPLAQCAACKSYDVRRVPNVAGGRSLDMCRHCGHCWTCMPGELTAEQHSPIGEKART